MQSEEIKKIAIVTGASSGFGLEYSRQIVRRFPEIDQIWVIARREEKLLDLQVEFPEGKIVSFPLDLTKLASFEIIEQELKKNIYRVELLVNNAGFGRISEFFKEDQAYLREMLDLNVRAVVLMTKICLAYMGAGGKIINLSSAAACSPLPYFTSYAASKAFVSSFSLGISEELKKQGIKVLAVCPGPCDTEFFDIKGEKYRGGVKIRTAEEVVDKSFKALAKNKLLVTIGWDMKILTKISNFTPLKLLLRIAAKVKSV